MFLFAGADVFKATEGRVAAPQWPGVRDPAGVREQDTFTRVTQGPGRPRRLHGGSRPELPGDQLQAPAAHSSAGERKERVNAGGTAKRRQRSAAGRAAGGHRALIVPAKLPNGPRDRKSVV